jgi:hypothetical protein
VEGLCLFASHISIYVEFLNRGWSLSRETCNAELAHVKRMSGTARVLSGGFQLLLVQEITGMSSLRIRSCGQKGKFLLASFCPILGILFFLKEKYNNFSRKVTKFVIKGYRIPDSGFCPQTGIDENGFLSK